MILTNLFEVLFLPLLSPLIIKLNEQALDEDDIDMEIDLSNLGKVNTMFAALFRYSFC